MAYKLPWGSNFSTDDLSGCESKDDIYQNFPFLKLKENGLQMKPLGDLHSPNENTVRGTTGFIKTKQQAIKSSIKKGWERTSWPIPFLMLNTKATIFDRRHTVSALTDLELQYKSIGNVPTAEYERVFPKIGGIINTFSNQSIVMMASMWANVHGPNKDDTKDHQFENTIERILKTEAKRLNSEVHSLYTVDNAQKIFKYMGGHDRYEDPRTITRIPNNAIANLNSSEEDAGTNTINYDHDSVDEFIADNPNDWKPHNKTDDTTIYRVYTVDNIADHTRDVVNKILETVCLEENRHKDGEVLKKTKVLLYNKNQSKKAPSIKLSRKIFIEQINKGWYSRRDNILSTLPNDLLDLKEEFRKKLDDLELEIWWMAQLDGEETYELSFDRGEWPFD